MGSTPAQTTIQRGPNDGKDKKEGEGSVTERIKQHEQKIRSARSKTPPKLPIKGLRKKPPPNLPPKGRRKKPTSKQPAKKLRKVTRKNAPVKQSAPVTSQKTKPPFRPKLKERKPLVPRSKRPPKAQNPFQKIRNDLDAMIAPKLQEPTKVWTVKELGSQKGGTEGSTLYQDIVTALGEYHKIKADGKDTAEAKQSKAITAQVGIRNWKDSKTVKFQAVFSKDKRSRRTALSTLSEQLNEEGRRYTQVGETYYLRESCDELVTISQLPQGTAKEIKKKRAKYDTWLREMPSKPREQAMALRAKVVGWVNWANKWEEGEKKRQEQRIEAREKRFTEWLDKRKAAKGLAPKVLSQAGLAELSSQLEGIDPKHREAATLGALLKHWLRADTKLWFFSWVDEWEKAKRPAERIRYLSTAQARAKYELAFEGLQPYYVKRPPKGKNKKPKAMAKGIFVMTPGRKFYARRETPGRQKTFHHSSFLAGLPVGAAGVMWTEKNRLYLNLESGHYQPTMRHMANAVRGLLANGLSPSDLRNVMVWILDKKDLATAKMLASDFYTSLRQIKRGRPPMGRFSTWMQQESVKVTDPRIQDAAKVVP